MGICYIVAAMKTEYRIEKQPGDLVIAADGGYAQLGETEADFIIGDFDSLGYVPQEDCLRVYPERKDDTDMMLAVKLGLEKGYRSFVLLGGLGGRLDHTIANIQTLAYLSEHGAKGQLKSTTTDAYLVADEALVFPADTKGIFSVFSYGAHAQNVTISGSEYELYGAELVDAFPLGVSNCFKGNEVTISVGEGRLLVIHEKE